MAMPTTQEMPWASVALASDTWGRLRAAWRAQSPASRRRFWWWLGGGFAVCAALAAALSLAGRWLEPRGAWDGEPALVLRFAHDGPLDFQQALFLSQPGSTAMILPLAVIAAGIAVRRERPRHALALLATALLTKAVVGAGWLVWGRDRPEIVERGIAAPQGLSSFPSGHVAQTVAFYALLAWLWHARSSSVAERAVAWTSCALLVVLTAAARLRLGAHWPSDLVAGAVVGALWAAACARAIKT